MLDTTATTALGFDQDRLERIEPFLRTAYLDTGRLPMMQLAVARDGQPVYRTQMGTMGEGREALRDDVARLAVRGAEQILRKEVDPAVHADLLGRLKTEL